ncbi:MAG: hypothetical protein JJU03_05270 [Idiomarina sp.]|nr:hypothetical protein [Idiomarina sp.]
MESNANTSEQAAQVSAGSALHYISDERALGQQLNVAVHQQQRADFGYLLAMLSNNVLEHSASVFKPAASVAPGWQPPFAVSPAAPLAVASADFSRNPGADFQRSRADWRLQQALRPEGLNLVNDPKHIPANVMANCAHYVQQRYQGDQSASAPGYSDAANEPAENASNAADLIDIIDQLRGVDRAVA